MTPVQIAEAAVGAVLFALCLAGYIHTSGQLKHADVPAPDDGAAVKRFKKKKTRKKLFFAGVIISVWFLIGFVITFFSGRKGGLVIAFEMFSKRVDVFGVSVAQTTLISLAVCGIIAVLCVLFRVLCVPRFKDRPTGLQNAVEICVEAMDKMVVGVVGEKTGAALSPYMFSLALYMIGCAAVELFGLRAPTSDLTCTFAMGLLTFLLINIFGFKTLGFGGRLKSMGGAVPAMRPMMIPLKIVSDVAVPVSLACRLFGNMLGGMIVMELLKGALGGYAAGIPGVAGLYFNLFHPLIQAYIFITLSLTFIAEALEPVEESAKPKKVKKSA